jgi:uncharacterized repeat protein (TIGR03847 family)
MAESGNDFALVDGIGAEAVGPPGQRRFRLIARNGSLYASLWMEKEQLSALGTTIQQQIVRLGRPAARDRPAPLLTGAEVPASPDVEFVSGQIGLGYDEQQQQFVVFAYPAEAPEDEAAAWSGRFTVPQARSLSREIDRLVNAGRPKCPLCGLVLDAPAEHVCPRTNGHAKELAGG